MKKGDIITNSAIRYYIKHATEMKRVMLIAAIALMLTGSVLLFGGCGGGGGGSTISSDETSDTQTGGPPGAPPGDGGGGDDVSGGDGNPALAGRPNPPFSLCLSQRDDGRWRVRRDLSASVRGTFCSFQSTNCPDHRCQARPSCAPFWQSPEGFPFTPRRVDRLPIESLSHLQEPFLGPCSPA